MHSSLEKVMRLDHSIENGYEQFSWFNEYVHNLCADFKCERNIGLIFNATISIIFPYIDYNNSCVYLSWNKLEC